MFYYKTFLYLLSIISVYYLSLNLQVKLGFTYFQTKNMSKRCAMRKIYTLKGNACGKPSFTCKFKLLDTPIYNIVYSILVLV